MKDDSLSDLEFENELRALSPVSVEADVMAAWLNEIKVPDPNASTPGVRLKACAEEGSRGRWMLRSAWALAALFCLAGFVVGMLLLNFSDAPQEKSERAMAPPDPTLDPIVRRPLFSDLAFEPNALENRFVAVSDDGVVGVLGEVPFRRVRYQLADSYQWSNTEDGSRLEMIVPREEVLLLPLVTY